MSDANKAMLAAFLKVRRHCPSRTHPPAPPSLRLTHPPSSAACYRAARAAMAPP
jgi:hypothetical protein